LNFFNIWCLLSVFRILSKTEGFKIEGATQGFKPFTMLTSNGGLYSKFTLIKICTYTYIHRCPNTYNWQTLYTF
jgi:hypothetical protein